MLAHDNICVTSVQYATQKAIPMKNLNISKVRKQAAYLNGLPSREGKLVTRHGKPITRVPPIFLESNQP